MDLIAMQKLNVFKQPIYCTLFYCILFIKRKKLMRYFANLEIKIKS